MRRPNANNNNQNNQNNGPYASLSALYRRITLKIILISCFALCGVLFFADLFLYDSFSFVLQRSISADSEKKQTSSAVEGDAVQAAGTSSTQLTEYQQFLNRILADAKHIIFDMDATLVKIDYVDFHGVWEGSFRKIEEVWYKAAKYTEKPIYYYIVKRIVMEHSTAGYGVLIFQFAPEIHELFSRWDSAAPKDAKLYIYTASWFGIADHLARIIRKKYGITIDNVYSSRLDTQGEKVWSDDVIMYKHLGYVEELKAGEKVVVFDDKKDEAWRGIGELRPGYEWAGQWITGVYQSEPGYEDAAPEAGCGFFPCCGTREKKTHDLYFVHVEEFNPTPVWSWDSVEPKEFGKRISIRFYPEPVE